MKTILLLGCLSFVIFVAQSGAVQLSMPTDGEVLTGIQILFDWLPEGQADHYELELTWINGGEDSSGWDKKVITVDSPPLILSHIFEFGESYLWRVRPVSESGTSGSWSVLRTFSIEALPTLPNLTITHNHPLMAQPGLTLMQWLVVDNLGRVVLFHRPEGSGPRWNIKLLPSGHFLYLAQEHIQEASLSGETIYFKSDQIGHHHDVQPMPGGGYLTIQQDIRDLPLNGETLQWWGDRIVHYGSEGDSLWSWSVFDHLSIESDIDPEYVEFAASIGYFGWTHINTCLYIPEDDALLLSIRNLSRIVKVDYATKDIIWSMGAALSPEEAQFGDGLFTYQHAPELLPNGNILLFDNMGSDITKPVPPHSRAVEIELDNPAEPQSASVVWEYELDYFASVYGDADRLPNGNTLITGAPSDSESDDNWIHEVTAGGELVWELKTNLGLYRAERITSLYPQAFLTDIIKPIFSEVGPVTAGSSDEGRVSYKLSESLAGGTVSYQWTNGTDDPDSPHITALYGSELNSGFHDSITLQHAPDLVEGASYALVFEGVDFAGNQAAPVSTSIKTTSPNLPVRIDLSQNHPNPFNPMTTIEFALPRESLISLVVYNTTGQKVRELTSGHQAAGSHRVEWDGRDDSGRPVGSGVYFYRLQTGDFSRTRKMVLLK
ncbi:aryl-sulfate sulfotransferase [candidate division KSB1 bacterium]